MAAPEGCGGWVAAPEGCGGWVAALEGRSGVGGCARTLRLGGRA
ncbi:hypothetical protein [Amycolatopsis sp. NBRC 101858]|nr:hypothetical protein [Amycolatopsis sp. NBRC 101858]